MLNVFLTVDLSYKNLKATPLDYKFHEGKDQVYQIHSLLYTQQLNTVPGIYNRCSINIYWLTIQYALSHY